MGSRRVLVPLLVGLVLRIALLALLPESGRHTADTEFYLRLAANVQAGHGFSSEVAAPYTPSIERPPGYPTFIALTRIVAGDSDAALSAAQLLMDLMTIALVFGFARRRYGERVGFWAAMIYAALPFTAGVSVQYMSEGLAMFAVAAACYAHARAVERDSSWAWAIASGAAWGLAALARSYLAPLAAVAGVLAFVEIRRASARAGGASSVRAMVTFVLIGASSGAVVGSWVARNAYVASTTELPFVLLERFGSRDVFIKMYTPEFRAWSKSYDEPFYWTDWKKPPRANYLSAAEREEVASLFARIAENDGEVTPEMSVRFARVTQERYAAAPIRLYVWRPISVALKFWLSPRASSVRLSMVEEGGLPAASRAIAAIFLFVNCMFAGMAFLGLVVRARRREGDFWFLFSFPFALTVLLTVIVHRESRLVMPIFPIVAVAAGVGVDAFLTWVRGRAFFARRG